MKRLALILAVLILIACKKDSDGFRIYTVPANQHSMKGWKLHPITKKSLDFEFKTNYSWIWEDQYPQGITGWSKITGFSEGDHSKNSCIEVGYRYENGYMIIGGYGRADGVDASDDPSMAGRIDTLQMNATYLVRLSREGSRYFIRINGKEWSCKAGKSYDWGFRLNPYVGGRYQIAHKWEVPIKYQ